MTHAAPQITTIDALAVALQNTLGDGWTVTARFDNILAVTPLCHRIEITPLAYSYTDFLWTLVPELPTIPAQTVREIPDTDLTAAVATALQTLSSQHHAASIA
jgi:hypothetical protein